MGAFRKTGGVVTDILKMDGICFKYQDRMVLNNISFSVRQGEFVAVTGPNGCGKTTMLKIVLKMIAPCAGAVLFRGDNINCFSNSSLARQVASVMQTISPAAMKVKDYVMLGRLPYFKRYQFFETSGDVKIVQKYMEMTGTARFADAKMHEISGGERQLAAIARALTQEPALLVLDEPTAHLDITHQARILSLLVQLKNQLSLTILMVVHDLNLASEFADRVVLIDRQKGEIFSEGTAEKVLTARNIEQVYHVPVQVSINPVSKTPQVFLVNNQNMKMHEYADEVKKN